MGCKEVVLRLLAQALALTPFISSCLPVLARRTCVQPGVNHMLGSLGLAAQELGYACRSHLEDGLRAGGKAQGHCGGHGRRSGHHVERSPGWGLLPPPWLGGMQQTSVC